eukprot:gene2845-3106_t
MEEDHREREEEEEEGEAEAQDIEKLKETEAEEEVEVENEELGGSRDEEIAIEEQQQEGREGFSTEGEENTDEVIDTVEEEVLVVEEGNDLEAHPSVEEEEVTVKRVKTVPKKPTSKWVLFLSEHRAQCSRENPDLSFAAITKLLAEQYKNISADESARLDQIVAKQKETWLQYQSERAQDPPRQEQEGQTEEERGQLIFPLARVRKVVKMDPDVRNVSKEGAVALTKASELFLGYLAERSRAYASLRGGRSIQLDDLLQAIHTQQDLSFLTDDFPRRAKVSHSANKLSSEKKTLPSRAHQEPNGEDGVREAKAVEAVGQNFFLPRQTGSKHRREEDITNSTS